MTEKRYKRLVSSIDYYYCIDTTNDDKGLTEKDMLNRLNEQDKEISELKQTIKEVYGILCIDVDVFSDKATEHDIITYIELRELDNKDAYYMAKGTKKAIELLKKVIK